jgi:serine/threonine protein kinase
MALTPGTRLAHFEIVSALAAGGMGEVYRAHDTDLGRQVALKVLPAAMFAHTARLVQFRREAKTLAALNHPNIITILSVDHAQDTQFSTMELVDGKRWRTSFRRGDSRSDACFNSPFHSPTR